MNIDTIWFEKKFPKSHFGVVHTTDVTIAWLKLHQIRKITDAKFFVLAPEKIISEFHNETINMRFSVMLFSQEIDDRS